MVVLLNYQDWNIVLYFKYFAARIAGEGVIITVVNQFALALWAAEYF
jgi:hypothetical protein